MSVDMLNGRSQSTGTLYAFTGVPIAESGWAALARLSQLCDNGCTVKWPLLLDVMAPMLSIVANIASGFGASYFVVSFSSGFRKAIKRHLAGTSICYVRETIRPHSATFWGALVEWCYFLLGGGISLDDLHNKKRNRAAASLKRSLRVN